MRVAADAVEHGHRLACSMSSREYSTTLRSPQATLAATMLRLKALSCWYKCCISETREQPAAKNFTVEVAHFSLAYSIGSDWLGPFAVCKHGNWRGNWLAGLTAVECSASIHTIETFFRDIIHSCLWHAWSSSLLQLPSEDSSGESAGSRNPTACGRPW